MNDKGIIIGIIATIVGFGGMLFIMSGGSASPSVKTPVATGDNVALAQCLKDKQVTFFGAFWCSHCKQQKALFGDAVPALPYVECSTPDGNGRNKICIDKNIESYPTWEFPDGTRLTGEQSLETLAEKSGCSLTGTSLTLTATTTSENVQIEEILPISNPINTIPQ